MIDWHSHVLPGIDDGSRNVMESIALIETQKAQGVSTVVATPHFYANDGTVEAFLSKRNRSYEHLLRELPVDAPRLRLGAEVSYYPGIARMDGLKNLRIEGTRLILIEMPMTVWTEYMLRELAELSGRSDFCIVLAHFERYLSYQNHTTWERIYESGILIQSNASFFASFATRRKAVGILGDGGIQFIGSDCHNMQTRPPRIDEAMAYIRRKLGNKYIDKMNRYGYSMLDSRRN